MNRQWLVSILVVAGLAPVLGASAEPRACLTTPNLQNPLTDASREATLLYFVHEERRAVASGRKLLLVRGRIPESRTEALRDVVEVSYRRLVGELGFRGFPDRISVSFAQLGQGEGLVHTSSNGSAAEIILTTGLSDDRLLSALAHQLGHLAGGSYRTTVDSWWSEATATWLEAKIVSGEDTQHFAETDVANPWTGLPEITASTEWLSYLETRFGATIVSRIWEELAARGDGDVIASIEAVLASVDSTLGDEMEGYAAWFLVETRRQVAIDGLARPLQYTVQASAYPSRGSLPGPGPLGTTFLRFESNNVAGSLRIEVSSGADTEWVASAVVVASGQMLPSARVSLDITEDGRASIAVPTSDISEVIIAVTNLERAGSLPFDFSVTTDDRHPYVLSRLEATLHEPGVRVLWDTEEEADIFGWSVLRGSIPGQPFEALNGVLVPGISGFGLDGGAQYQLVDAGVESGETYYYYVQALTSDGLPASSHIVSITIP